MALSIQHRKVGKIAVLTCNGRIVEGADSAQLDAHVTGLLPHEPFVVLNLADVSFLDSSGLGLLVRLMATMQRARGGLKLCALPPRVTEILRMTRLHTTLASYPTDADAIAAFYERDSSQETPHLETDILCVDSSDDVLAYLRALLRQAGYGVMTAANVYDALILLRVTRPAVVVAGVGIRAFRGTRTAETFHDLADRLGVIELDPGFSGEDAGEAGQRLLERIAKVVSPRK
ncbi:MAG: anti-sigma factor antagonist [Vicinamibacterales bacterium]